MQKKILLIFSLLAACLFGFGQDLNTEFVHLSTKQGMSDNMVTMAVQDKLGFIWFASKHGLMRYNGYEFAVFQLTPNDTSSLTNNHVRSLLVRSNGQLLVGTARGLNIYQQSNNSFQRLLYKANKFNSAAANVSALTEDLHGTVWIGTGNQQGLYCIQKNGLVQNWKNKSLTDKTLLSNTILALVCDYYGVLWIGTDEGLMSYDSQNKIWQKFTNQDITNSKNVQFGVIKALHIDEQNNVWIGASAGLFCYNRQRNSFVRYPYLDQNNVIINQISNINENTLALATDGAGLLLFNTITEKWTSIQHDPTNNQSVRSNSIQSILKDAEGNWWLAAGTYGLDVLYNQKNILNSFVSNPKNPKSLSFSSITTIYEDSYRRIWVGTDGGGLNLFDKQTETFKYYVYNPQNNQSLGSNTVTTLLEDAAGMLWVGTSNGGLQIFNVRRGTFTRLQHDAANTNSLSNNNVSDLFSDSTGNLWIATLGGGVDKYNPVNRTFTHYKVQYGQSNCLSSNYVTSICQDMQGNLWFGTQGNHVDRYNLKTKTFHHYGLDKGVVSEYINSILRCNDGSVWLATSGGLNRFVQASDCFIPFKPKGLLSNEILGIVEAANDTLWVATPKGLCRVNHKTNQTECYNVFDGLLSNSINPNAISLASDGRLYLGSPLGLNYIKPQQLCRKSFNYPLLITDLQVFLSDTATNLIHKDLLNPRDMELTYRENSIAIDYQALTINNAKNIRYAYKLEGLHNNWVQAGNQRRAIFIKLKEGRYTFRLKAFVDDHPLTQQVAIVFSVSPPWWRSWWMYVVYFAVFIAFFYFVWQFSVLKIKTNNKIALEQKEREKLIDIFSAKMNLFTEISHDIRTPLTLVIEPITNLLSNHSNKQSNEYRQLERIAGNAQKILNLTDQLLDFRRLDSGGIILQASENDIVSFCKKIVATFTDLSRQRNLQLHVKCDEQSIMLWFDADKLEKLLDNLIANAIKYTPMGGTVSLSIERKIDTEQFSVRKWFKKQIIERQLEQLVITVTDTGCGIVAEKLPFIFDRFYNIEDPQQPDNERGHGLGLFIVKHLVSLHYGTINVISETQKGSSFIIHLPMGNEHLHPSEMIDGSKIQISIPKQETVVIEKEESIESAEFASKPVLLVVDDERDIIEYIVESLENHYQIISCSNGAEAQELAIQTVPDAIIADVMMPFMDGFELCSRLRKDIITCHIPIILLTARNIHESKIKGFESGADAYLTKPFSMKELSVRIETLLVNRRRVTDYFKQEMSHYIANQNSNFAEQSASGDSRISDPFLEKANQIIEKYYNDPEFSVVKFAEEMFMSRSQLFRKLKAVADVTPNDYIRTFRLERAAQILRNQHHLSISEIAYEVGFTSLQYFSSCFQKYFGMTPSEFSKQEVN